MDYDLLVKNGRIVDGSGMPSFQGDVAVRNGKIVELGRLSGSARRVIDAEGTEVSTDELLPVGIVEQRAQIALLDVQEALGGDVHLCRKLLHTEALPQPPSAQGFVDRSRSEGPLLDSKGKHHRVDPPTWLS